MQTEQGSTDFHTYIDGSIRSCLPVALLQAVCSGFVRLRSSALSVGSAPAYQHGGSGWMVLQLYGICLQGVVCALWRRDLWDRTFAGGGFHSHCVCHGGAGLFFRRQKKKDLGYTFAGSEPEPGNAGICELHHCRKNAPSQADH